MVVTYHDTEIPPPGGIVKINTIQEDVGRAESAKLAVGGSVGVGEVTACLGYVGGHVGTTGLTVRRLEFEIFDAAACNVGVGDTSRKHAVDQI